jgi:hypothetical protein
MIVQSPLPLITFISNLLDPWAYLFLFPLFPPFLFFEKFYHATAPVSCGYILFQLPTDKALPLRYPAPLLYFPPLVPKMYHIVSTTPLIPHVQTQSATSPCVLTFISVPAGNRVGYFERSMGRASSSTTNS